MLQKNWSEDLKKQSNYLSLATHYNKMGSLLRTRIIKCGLWGYKHMDFNRSTCLTESTVHLGSLGCIFSSIYKFGLHNRLQITCIKILEITTKLLNELLIWISIKDRSGGDGNNHCDSLPTLLCIWVCICMPSAGHKSTLVNWPLLLVGDFES